MLLDPPVILAGSNNTIIANSVKYPHYGPGLTQQKYRLGSMQDCVNTSVTGTYQATNRAVWLTPYTRRMIYTLEFIR